VDIGKVIVDEEIDGVDREDGFGRERCVGRM